MKDLVDLAKGIHQADDEEAYIAQQMQDITSECRSKESRVKTEAIRKLTYLYLLGYDIKSYAFHAIECMSSQDFAVKKNGYFASYFSFGSPDMATLSTNLYANDLRHKSEAIRSIALSSLASCPCPNASQFNTLFPVLLDYLHIIINNSQSVALLNKNIAAIARFLIQTKTCGIDVDDAPARFVEVLYNLAQQNIISADAMSTQIFTHVALELAGAFGAAITMRLVPYAFDILITAKQPWVLLDVVKFFAVVAKHDARVCEKVGKHFYYLLQTTESRSLEMELAAAIAHSFANEREMILFALTKMAYYVAPAEGFYSDENLRILAVKNIAALQKCYRGVCGEVPGLTAAIIKLLDDVDFSVKTAALEVIHGMANQHILQSIVNKLLQTLKDTKSQNAGQSIAELHQVSPTDILEFKASIVEVVVDICCEQNYANITDFQWLMGVFVTLAMEHTESSAALVAPRFLDLALRSTELRGVLPGILLIVLKNSHLQISAQLSDSRGSLASLTPSGGVLPFKATDLQQDIITFSHMLYCTYCSSQEQAADALGEVLQRIWRTGDTGVQFEQLTREFYYYMTNNNLATQRSARVRELVCATEERVVRADELENASATSRLLQACAWVTGMCLYFYNVAEAGTGVNARVDEVLDVLTSGGVAKFPGDLAAVFLTAAVRAFASLVSCYENALADPQTARCFPVNWFSEVFLVKRVAENVEDSENKQNDNDAFDPHASLVKTLAYCYSMLLQRLPTFVQSAQSQMFISALINIVRAAAAPLQRGVNAMGNEELREQLKQQVGAPAESDDKPPSVDQFLTFNPEVSVAATRQLPHPAFAFYNGKVFSLDHDDMCILGDADLFAYCPEEYTMQERQRHHKKHAEAAAFDAFVDKPVEECPSAANATPQQKSPATSGWGYENEIEAAFGGQSTSPAIRSAFIIDKNKLQRKEEIQTNKYTAGLKIEKISIQGIPPPAEPGAQTAQKPVVETYSGEKRHKRHKKHANEAQGAEEIADAPEPVQAQDKPAYEQPKPAPAPEPAKAADDDLMSLIM